MDAADIGTTVASDDDLLLRDTIFAYPVSNCFFLEQASHSSGITPSLDRRRGRRPSPGWHGGREFEGRAVLVQLSAVFKVHSNRYPLRVDFSTMAISRKMHRHLSAPPVFGFRLLDLTGSLNPRSRVTAVVVTLESRAGSAGHEPIDCPNTEARIKARHSLTSVPITSTSIPVRCLLLKRPTLCPLYQQADTLCR